MSSPLSPRAALDTLVRFNQRFVGGGRDPAWLRAKLDRMSASPLGFLRGSFHLFVDDWAALGDDPFGGLASQPIVGDLHIENFGAYRAADGSAVFDVNDFDEAARGTPAVDLVRLATSLILVEPAPGPVATAAGAAAIAALLDAWAAALKGSEVTPLDRKTAPPALHDYLQRADDASRARWLDKRLTGKDKRCFVSSDKYQPLTDSHLRDAIIAALLEFGHDSADRPHDLDDWPTVLDVAARLAGTGSLGRFRWAVLIAGRGGHPGKERILELKEALPSSLAPSAPGDPAARVVTLQRQLQAAPPAYLGAVRVDGLDYTVRELQPSDQKVQAADFASDKHDALPAALGTALGRLHRRGGGQLAAQLPGDGEALHQRIAAAALRYAEATSADWEALCHERAAVEERLFG